MRKCGIEKYSDKYKKELFKVYNLILTKQYYKTSLSEYLPVELFRTILLHGLNMKKFKWTYEFINKYKNNLHPNRRETMSHYSNAQYLFYRGKYEEAMDSFHKIHLDHFMLKIDLKNLMLMTYYELGLFENALSLIDTYKHFLKNDKTLSVEEKRKQKNFISIMNKMIQFRMSFEHSDKYYVSNLIKNDLPHKDWLREKILMLDRSYNKSA